MRRVIVTQTRIWELEVPDLPNTAIQDAVETALEDDPDYEGTEVEVLG